MKDLYIFEFLLFPGHQMLVILKDLNYSHKFHDACDSESPSILLKLLVQGH